MANGTVPTDAIPTAGQTALSAIQSIGQLALGFFAVAKGQDLPTGFTDSMEGQIVTTERAVVDPAEQTRGMLLTVGIGAALMAGVLLLLKK